MVKLNDTEKVSLINEIAVRAYNETESWIDDDKMGANLAYLFWSIASDDFVDLSETPEIVESLTAWFPQEHLIWQYIST